MNAGNDWMGPVALVAETGSAIATRVATQLAARRLLLARQRPDGADGLQSRAVLYLLERETACDGLRLVLERSTTPVLVLAVTQGLALRALPLLGERHDLALANDPPDVLAWRLRRLVESSRRPAASAADLDPLTGLLNRRAFQARLQVAIASHSPDRVVGLLMLDLDQFKVINDELGHAAGDEMLAEFSRLLGRWLTPADAIARFGGDEFVCLLFRRDVESIRGDAARLLRDIARADLEMLGVHASQIQPTASAGLTFVRADADAEQLLREADHAMYEAKSSGRNRLTEFKQLAEAARRTDRDLHQQHFENVTRVATERLVEMITQRSRSLLGAARQEANVCALTGLNNRRYFDVQLPRDIERARASGRPLSLALLDIDHFHAINMNHGWPTGDRVLQGFAGVAQSAVRRTDWIARYGGEEFVVVLPDTTARDARAVLERLRNEFAEMVTQGIERESVCATLSGGIAQLDAGMQSPIDFVNAASRAALRSKAEGRNRLTLYEDAEQPIDPDDAPRR